MFSVFKGWFGEKLTTFGLWLGLDDNIYRRIHDIILYSDDLPEEFCETYSFAMARMKSPEIGAL